MRIGIAMHNFGGLMRREAMLAIAARAEELGYASLWTSDHLLVPSSYDRDFTDVFESLVTLAYLAGRTERIELGTSVLVLSQRDPVLVAKQAATIDALSGGRLRLGVGTGWIAEESELSGFPFAGRGRRMDEFIRALRELWTADDAAHAGETLRFPDVRPSPRPVRPGGIPLLVGGNSSAALRRAATLGDGWHALGLTPPAFRDAVARIAELGGGRPFELSLRLGVALGQKPQPGRFAMVGGESAAVADSLARYRAAGVEHLVADFQFTDLDSLLRALETFAHDVRPRLDG